MKNLNRVPVFLIALTMALFSCSKEELNINKSIENEKELLFSNNELLKDLSNQFIYNLENISYTIIDDNTIIFNLPVEFKSSLKNSTNIVESKVEILTDISQNKSVPLVRKVTEIENNELKYSYSFLSSGDNIGFVTSGGGIDIPVSNCQGGFNECFMCAWNSITSDWVGTLACATNPWSCGAAAALYCALGANPGNQNIYSY